MGTLGSRARNGKKQAVRGLAHTKTEHPAVAKLAAALREHKASLEQQAATAEILRAMSSSPGDAQPVFEAIVEKAHRLCDASYSVLYRYDGNQYHFAAAKDVNLRAIQALRTRFPQQPDRRKIVGRAILDRRTFHTPDIGKDPRFPGSHQLFARRAVVSVPLMRDGTVLGVIACGRAQPTPFTKKEIWLLKTFADQAVIAIENARLFNDTREALERQTATAEILKIISSSPTDVQPVFDGIAKNAMRLFGASSAVVTRRIGEVLHLAAFTTTSESGDEAIKANFPVPLSDVGRQHVRAVLAKAPRYTTDTEAPDATPAARRMGRARGYRSSLAVPMLREGEVVGTIAIARGEPGPFSKQQIELLATFADQAVIAIENVRLFNETKEALEHQKASAEVLRIVAGSVENTDPVFEAITAAGVRLIPGARVALILVRGRQLHYVSHSGISPERRAAVAQYFPVTLNGPRTVAIAAIQEKRLIHIEDIEEIGEEFALAKKIARASGYRSMLTVPLVREGEAIGTLAVTREQPGRFNDKQVELAKTFADQAVIAIQNAKMFGEIQERNADLKQALERQTATSDILRVISRSPADLRPVFDAISRHFTALCGAQFSTVFTYDGELVHYAGGAGLTPERERIHRAKYPVRVDDPSVVSARTVFTRDMVHVHDTLADAHYEANRAAALGTRRILGVPLLRDGVPLGAMVAGWTEPGVTPAQHEDVLRTFADQAVIAIENLRLFNETKEALERQTATADILKIISSSPTDVQPVFDGIAKSALQLLGGLTAVVTRVVGDMEHLAAFTTTGPAGDETLQKLYPARIGDLNSGVAVLTRAPAIRTDTETDPTMSPAARENARARGFRSVIAVPMLRDGVAIGAISVSRREPGPFSKHQSDLLTTFGDQAVIAIENVRLFNETKESLEQQTATAEILRVISRTPTDIQPVFEAIAKSAMRIFEGMEVAVALVDGSDFLIKATSVDHARVGVGLRLPLDRNSAGGRATLDQVVVNIADTESPETPAVTRQRARDIGFRAFAAAPMLREGKAIGHIAVMRHRPVALSEKEIALLRTFADQAVIAIENARLFNETKEALEHQEASADILRIVASSVENTDPVFAAITSAGMRLFPDVRVSLSLAHDGQVHYVSHSGVSQERRAEIAKFFPRPLDRDTVVATSIVDSCIIHVPDIAVVAEKYPISAKTSAVSGWRAMLAVPLLENGKAIGCLGINRTTAGPFSEKQIALAQTFADQAVIAIRNARLFNETKEALEHQKVSADILRIVASSVANTDPVFRAITDAAMRLVPGCRIALHLARDGHLYHISHSGVDPEDHIAKMARFYPIPVDDAQRASARAVKEKRVVHIADVEAVGDEMALGREMARISGWRAILAVPLMRAGEAIGNIAITRSTPGLFSEKQITLMQTFADQAVIAIENARLFNETKEALEQQTATAEILKVISSSPTATQPVLDAIVESAARLFPPCNVGIIMREGDVMQRKANAGPRTSDIRQEALAKLYPMPFDPRRSLSAQVILGGRIVEVLDTEAPGLPESVPLVARAAGYRSVTVVPLIREGTGIGVIGISHPEPGFKLTEKQLALLQTFADQAVIAIENVRLFNETKDALEQQTAVAEVLRVISSSPTDVKPVLESVAVRAARICDAADSRIFLVEGQHYRNAAGFGEVGVITGVIPLNRDTPSGRAIVDRTPQHIEDITALPADELPLGREIAARSGWRTILTVPLLREDRALGTIVLRRKEVRRFSDQQIALLKTFADQAAIAIENVRLFNETKEALEQQTATSNILSVISSSPTDLAPVFDAILKSALELCEAHLGHLNLYDGEHHRTVAHRGGSAEFGKYLSERGPYKPGPTLTRVAAERRPVQVPDMRQARGYLEGKTETVKLVELGGARTALHVPLVKEDKTIGVMVIYRPEVQPFTQKQVALVSLFANQAVIAIENVRLFNETKEALEQQTSISEILRVISSSPSDVRPVLDAVAQRAARICDASDARIHLVEGDRMRHTAGFGDVPLSVALGESIPITRGAAGGRSVIDRATVHVEDMQAQSAGEYPVGRERAERGGWHTVLAVPLMREQRPLGCLVLRRKEVRAFGEKQIALLKTFADQAAIAIENVRLFNATKEALEQQTATSEILKVISASPTATQPVFEAIVQSAARLFAPCNAVLVMREGHLLQRKARAGAPGQVDQAALAKIWPIPLDPDRSMAARCVLERRIIEMPDTEAPELPAVVKTLAKVAGYRAITLVPLIRKGEGIGLIALNRPEPGFKLTDKQLTLVRTFADQAVIAIENVRLFKELEERTEALTRSVSQLTALGEVGQAISSTLELETVLKTIVQRAVQLTGMDSGAVYEYDEGVELFRLQAAERFEPELVETVRRTPIRKGDGATGRIAVTFEAEQVPDIEADTYRGTRKDVLVRAGYRAVLAVPLLRDNHLLGALQVFRRAPGPFAPEVVELLKTFATQSAMAIQNARLFREIAEKGKQLEVASRHKSDFLASMSHELRTPLNALIGFNELILGDVYGEVPADMKPPLAQMQSSGKHLLRLINNVLDLAKIEAGRMELALMDYSVHDVVESVRSTLQPLAQEKGLEFLAEVPADIPLAHGDAGRITQCLMNLAGNSLKFTKAGKVEISVALNDRRLRYCVADTGIGIPPEKVDSLFTEFKQTDATIASEYGGTGLGLSISKKFVELHGGRIWVESQVGKGSAFSFEVPLRAEA